MGEVWHGCRRGRWLVLAVFVCLGVFAAQASAATTGVIPGNPLTIYADDNGALQVVFNGSSSGEFFAPTPTPASAGLKLAVTGTGTDDGPFTVFGFNATSFSPRTPPSPPTLTGDGSPGNPWKLTTTYDANTPSANRRVTVAEVVSYVNGTTDLRVEYGIVNTSDGATLNVRAYEAADLYVAGDDHGTGFLDPGPPLQVGGINAAAGSSGRLVEVTQFNRYQEGPYGDVFSVVDNTDQTAVGLTNTVDPSLVDNGVAAQWNFPSLAPNAAQPVSVVWRFKRFTALQLAAATASRITGQTATVNVAARNSDGNADPGRPVRYTIAGANPGSGAVNTGADGTAAIAWTGANAGIDTVTAFTDLNANGVRDANEPQQAVTVTWTAAPPPPPPPPPVPGKSVVVQVVSGQVFIKYPKGKGPRAAAPKGFAPFTGAANIPVGSQLDTRKGRIKLTSAADTGGKKTQASDFYQGVFEIKQALPKVKKKKGKPVALTTDLGLKNQISRSQCAPLKARAAVVSAKKKKKGPKSVLGKLWGNGKGKFRTTGKYSSATVRGTIWLTQDECDGTLTRVSRGTVSVRDFKRKKTVKVKAKHSYLARAQSVKKKKRRR